MNVPTTLAVLLLGIAPLTAQRQTPTLEVQKRLSMLAYGAVPLGKHGLSELAAGKSWRLGFNTASTWRTEMPVLIGERLLAPGEYRIKLLRLDEIRCAIEIDGSALALGKGGDLRVEGLLATAKKEAKSLDISWRKRAGKDKSMQPATIAIAYGEHEWSGDVALLTGKDSKLGGYQLTVFAVPATLLAARQAAPVPVAVISKGKGKELKSFQIVLDGDEAVLRPFLEAPTEQSGFGAVKAPSADLTTTGKVVATTTPGDKEVATLQLVRATIKKQDVTMELRAGTETFALTIAIPEEKVEGK